MDINLLSEEDKLKIQELAKEVLRQAQNRLVVRLRFLDLALGQFNNSTYTNFDIPSYITNGKVFIYNPVTVINHFTENKNTVIRDFLHVVFHCVYRHMFISSMVEQKYWDLACDIAIENMIDELDIDCLFTPRVVEQRRIVNKIRSHVKYVTAECIYDYLRTGVYNDFEIMSMTELFFVDSHEPWYKTEQSDNGEQKGDGEKEEGKQEGNSGNSSSNNKNKDDNENSSDENQGKDGDGEGSNGEGEGEDQNDKEGDGSGNGGSEGEDEENDKDSSSSSSNSNSSSNSQNNTSSITGQDRKETEQHWKDISEKVQVDLETFNKERGDQASSMMQNLREVNREKYDYTEFLKKFSKMGEVMKINDDEFDYVFYTYGLNLYKNMPLVEPLEYKDVKRIKDFVIAIDTSGSVEGDLVQTFLQKTYNILKNSESFFSKINVHIIQCDAAIQEDKKITNEKEFDDYIKNMKLLGFGGTDFRPVFDYVDELIKQKEFDNLKGLIYFTDGCGVYPPSKPDYQTAFVFIEDNDFNDYHVPAWAVKLILQKKDLK